MISRDTREEMNAVGMGVIYTRGVNGERLYDNGIPDKVIANRLESLYRPYHKTLTSVRSPVIPIALSLTCTHTPRNHYHMSFTSMIAVP